MRVFVTGASGFIGSAVVPELIGAGHRVIGLARSEASAQALTAAGAQVQRGELDDLESLRAGADQADGVIHLAFKHDFADFAAAAKADRLAVETLGATLAGTGRPLVITSGTLGLRPGQLNTERDRPIDNASASPRFATELVTLALAEQGVRPSVVRLAPAVHDRTKVGFVSVLVDIARRTGVSGFRGDGSQRWSAVHRRDAAQLFRRAVEQAPAGSVLHGVDDEGLPLRTVAEVIGRGLNVPVAPIPDEQADKHFGFLSRLVGLDSPTSSALTRELLGWQPTHPGLVDDLEHGHFFDEPTG